MTLTTVTVTGTATFPGGQPIPNAVVSFIPDRSISQAGTSLGPVETYANANGAWSAAVTATDDAGTAPAGGGYNVAVRDPSTEEIIEQLRCHVPSATTSTTITALRGSAF